MQPAIDVHRNRHGSNVRTQAGHKLIGELLKNWRMEHLAGLAEMSSDPSWACVRASGVLARNRFWGAVGTVRNASPH